MILEENNSGFITYEIPLGFYTFKDSSEVLLRFLQSESEGYLNAIDIEFDDITLKTKFVLRPGIIFIKFDDKPFLSTVLGFTPGWDYKNYNEYISQKLENISNTKKIHLKCDFIDGSAVNGLRQPFLFSFVLEKPSVYKVFCEPETIHYEKNKSVLNTITFYLEDDNNKEVVFYRKTLTFTLQTIKS